MTGRKAVAIRRSKEVGFAEKLSDKVLDYMWSERLVPS